MLAALVIVFREVLEAGLIVGIVLAASRGVNTFIWGGSLAKVAARLALPVDFVKPGNGFWRPMHRFDRSSTGLRTSLCGGW